MSILCSPQNRVFDKDIDKLLLLFIYITMNSFLSILVVLLIVLIVAFIVFSSLWLVQRFIKTYNSKDEFQKRAKKDENKLDSKISIEGLEIPNIERLVTPNIGGIVSPIIRILPNTEDESTIFMGKTTTGESKNMSNIPKNSDIIIGHSENYKETLPLNGFQETLRNMVSNLRPGRIAFNTPDTMYSGETVIIELKITDNLLEELKIEEEGKITTKTIDIHDSMKAILTGVNFDIEPLTEEIQIVPEDKVITWKWGVTPTRSGKQRLFLYIYAIFLIDAVNEPLYLNSFNYEIKVKVKRRERLKKIFSWFFLNGVITGVITILISKYIINYLKYKNWINLSF